jgi:23S rRNA maturation-related 3'-5' exoribonuclease YhaM
MELPNPLFALVIDQEKRQTKNGDRFFWQNILKTTVGNIKCFMWNAPPDAEVNPRYPHEGDIIEATDYQDQTEERNSIVLKSFKRYAKEELPDDQKSIMEFEKASDEDMKWALNLIGDSSFWNDKKHHKFTMSCLAEIPKELLRACPAATHVHHHYAGGLIIHLAEVLELCRSTAETCVRRYPFINRDVLYASAILHDVGKCRTYYVNDLGTAKQLPTEKTIGHLFYGMHLVELVANKTKSIDWLFVNEILHCIASHHGLPEYGSLKVVQSLESGILSRMDYISSRNGMVEYVLDKAIKSGQHLEDNFTIYGDSYFSSIGMQEYITEKTSG